VVEVRVFSRRGIDKDERALSNERSQIEQLHKDMEDEKFILESSFKNGLSELLLDQNYISGLDESTKIKSINQSFINDLSLVKL